MKYLIAYYVFDKGETPTTLFEVREITGKFSMRLWCSLVLLNKMDQMGDLDKCLAFK